MKKTAVITGAAGGLGRAFALAFSEAGMRVVVCDLNLKGAEETAALVGQSGGEAIAFALDVADEQSARQLADAVARRYGRTDVLINNAAVYAALTRKPFFDISEKEWDLVMNVNLKGVWLCAKAFVPLLKQSAGKIVNISSATVMSGSPQWAHYVASKAGVIGLTRVMARELGDFNICVNAVAPGFTLTEASLNLIENADRYGVERGAIKRASAPEDIVGAVLFLASSAADFMTGQTLVVDGGKQFI